MAKGYIASIVFILLFCFVALQSHAQYGNEWINYNVQHWKIRTANSGLFEISYNDLLSAGFPVNNASSDLIQLFGQERKLKYKVIDGNDGTFNPGDKILIWLNANDGWLDDLVYDNPQNHVHPYYSLFNDTATYYISYDPNQTALHTSLLYAGNPDDYPVLPFLRKKVIEGWSNEYFIGKQDNNAITLPFYEAAEGWYDNRFPKGGSSVKDILTPNAYTGLDAPNAEVLAVSASVSSANGNPNHHLQIGYGNPFQLVMDSIYHGYQLNKISFQVPAQSVGATTRITHKSINDLNVATDFHAVSYIEIDYARNNDFSGPSASHFFSVQDHDLDGIVRIDLLNYSSLSPALFTLDEYGFIDEEIQIQPNGNTIRALIAMGAGSIKNMLLCDLNTVSANIIEPVNTSGYFVNYAANPLDSAFIIVTHKKLLNYAQNYASYRNNGQTESLLADVEELYHQYGAGIYQNPLAIRRFCDHLLNTWPQAPSSLFLVGKSVHSPSISNTPGSRKSVEAYANTLVPTWGYPSSDVVFTSGLAGTITEPAIPTGRLAAINGDQVLDYLNKVVQHESAPAADWMKQILHFGGGGNEFEQTLFENYLHDYEVIAEDTCFGGNVHTFLKSNSDPIQFNLSDSIQTLIESGVSIMTFFGHATSNGFDQNIDHPSAYNNNGKYPILIGNSCYTGNVHLPTFTSTSEIFVLYPYGGTIGFIAKGDVGIPGFLDAFTNALYKRFAQKSYGYSIGHCMKKCIEDIQGAGGNFYINNTTLTLALHGDPAIRVHSHELPDFLVEAPDISFNPSEVSTELDSFVVYLALHNIGKAINQPLSTELIRHFPDGSDTSYTAVLPHLYYRDTLRFKIEVDRLRGVGMNRFDVLVDYPADLISELNDNSNNVVIGVELLITSGDLLPVFPQDYAVIPQTEITLYASTGNPFQEMRNYRIELDTVPEFNSAFLQFYETGQSGGLISWSPSLLNQDSTVYFWRCSAIPEENENQIWHQNSFQYINNQSGWGQADFDQFKDNGFSNIEAVEISESFDFVNTQVPFSCYLYGNSNSNFESLDTRYQIGLEIQDYSGCGNPPAIHVAVVDPITLLPWETNYLGMHPEYDFGNLLTCTNSRARPEKYFIFRQNNESQLIALADMLSNSVPDGHFLLVYSWKYATYDNWDLYAPELAQVFADMGVPQIGAGQDSVTFIFFQQKGNPESTILQYGSTIDDYLELQTALIGTFGNGQMNSPVIGPADNWHSLHWLNFPQEELSSDSIALRLFGISNSGQRSLLNTFYGLSGDESDLSQANGFPYLQLEASIIDSINITPSQPHRWHVLHDQTPEAALNPNLYFVFEGDTLKEGEDILYSVAISNAGETDMDSLLIHYWIENESRERTYIPYSRQDSLRVGETLIDSIYFNTQGLSGRNYFWVEVNPALPEGGYDQLELSHFNNIAQRSFFVVNDEQNPVLDVSIDGKHILDGELVSAKPYILITLKDENPFFIMEELSDTSFFKLFLTDPGGHQRQIYFENFSKPDLIRFNPATASNRKCSIEYTPVLEQDGTYLLLVQATDKSGNESGSNDYRISFEIDNKPSITEILNYPNPFSSRTQFVFSLTGSEVPDQMQITIMTITGRVVRQINATEIGPLRIGRNQTEFWWDGTDEFGDPLANGIYLYTVSVKLRGEDLELRENAASRFFAKGVGKMYLMR